MTRILYGKGAIEFDEARYGADVIITSNGGAPLDQNLYQCVKGMTASGR